MIAQKHRHHTGSKQRFAWIYSSKRWKAIRQRALNRADGQCEECFSIGEVQVHHRTPVSLGGAIWDLENLIVLCRSCHLEAHRRIEFAKMPDWQRRLYELVDKPIPRKLIRLTTTRPGGQLQ